MFNWCDKFMKVHLNFGFFILIYPTPQGLVLICYLWYTGKVNYVQQHACSKEDTGLGKSPNSYEERYVDIIDCSTSTELD